jgi:hypothetical protein
MVSGSRVGRAGQVQVKTMSIWRRRPGREENYGISAGQRFFSVGRTAAVWEVVNVARYAGDLAPHVRLSRVGSHHDGKTVSLEVLRDRRFYEPAPRGLGDPWFRSR